MRTLLVFVLAVTAGVPASAPAPRERSFTFEYAVTVKDIPSAAHAVDIWLPEPHDDAFQRITNLYVDSPVRAEATTGAEDNHMLHIRVTDPKEASMAVTIRFDAVRKEHIQPLPASAPESSEGLPEGMTRYLQPDRLVPLDDTIRRWARAVVDAAGAKTELEMARAIYNHVVATVKYDKTGKGWGNGDIYYACDVRRGNCTDFHAIFIGYARAVGIPARFAIGFPLPADRGAGKIGGYHCWAEFYAKGIGWVPVDASEAAKNPARREYFFGAHDENRVEFSKGRDVTLSPKQQGAPLNYFVYPYVELDGAKYTTLETSYSYKDLPR
ncbi:MAG TPA: transglutaminase domain-containing protein [Bryobacteraceae bacterium]|nr:transglutaminase domain-containing protein [Bryobacteraceae bacterium]